MRCPECRQALPLAAARCDRCGSEVPQSPKAPQPAADAAPPLPSEAFGTPPPPTAEGEVAIGAPRRRPAGEARPFEARPEGRPKAAKPRTPRPSLPPQPQGTRPFSLLHASPERLAAEQAQREQELAEGLVHPFVFHGTGETLFGLKLKNLSLTVLSLGVYHFWAKVAVRRYLWAATEFAGDRFAYHGNGKELLLGWLKLAGPFGLLIALGLWARYGADSTALAMGLQLAFYPLALLLAPLALVGGMRYRMTRTSWRGVRFGFDGKVREGYWQLFKALLWVMLSFGLATPFMQNRLRAFLSDHSRFGNLRFRYDGEAWPIAKAFYASLLLSPFTMGFSLIWYKAFREKHFWAHTTLGHLRFRSTLELSSYFGVEFVNQLLLWFSLGLARPWVQARSLKYLLGHLELVGPLDLDAVLQSAAQASAIGEAAGEFSALDFLDVGFDL